MVMRFRPSTKTTTLQALTKLELGTNVYAFWLKTVPDAAPNTQRRYATSLRNLARYGISTVRDVKPNKLTLFVAMRISRDRVTPGVVNGDLAALLSMLRALKSVYSEAQTLIELARRARMPVKRRRKRRAKFLTTEQLETLCWASLEVDPRLAPVIRLAALSGLRTGELCRLRRSDIHGRVIHVAIAPELGEDGRVKTNEERTVPICRPLAKLLRELPLKGFLFPSGGSLKQGRKPRHPYLGRDVLWAGLKRARELAGLLWVTWPVLRHTRASWWAQKGVPRTKIAEWLGNSDEVTETYYIGLDQGYDPDCEKMPT